MSRQFTKEQQEEINQLQITTQQLNTLQQSYFQMESSKKEIEGTLSAIKDKDDNKEIYRRIGQIIYQTNALEVREDLTEELESLTLKVSKVKKQIESMEKWVKDKDAQLRASLSI